MSELIDQLRNLRAAAYRKLTQNSDFKVLLELDEMLGRLDASDTPMAPPASPQAKSDDEDAEADEDIEAAPPEQAEAAYLEFVARARDRGVTTATGRAPRSPVGGEGIGAGAAPSP